MKQKVLNNIANKAAMKQQVSLGEHMIRTREFTQSLLDKMPEISNTIKLLYEIKKKTAMKNKWNPDEGIEDEVTMQEQDSSITEQSV